MSTIRDSSSRSLKSSTDIAFSEVEGNSSAKGAWNEGTLKAEERDREQHMARRRFRKRDIIFEVMPESLSERIKKGRGEKGCRDLG